MGYLIAYENSERGLAYYCDHGFPWWAYDKAKHSPTIYQTADAAERAATQLRAQRARAGKIVVVPA